MGKNPAWIVSLTLVALTLLTTAARATTVAAPVSLDQLTAASELIVHGQVTGIESRRDADHIFTTIELEVADRLKGDAAPGPVTIEFYGGIHNGIATLVVGSPSMAVGEEVVMFLKQKRTGVHHVLNLSEGKFQVVRTDGAAPKVERDLRGIHFGHGHDPQPMPETLDQLKSEIAASIEGSR